MDHGKHLIRRFPRLPGGYRTGLLGRRFWSRPAFKVREQEGYTEFVFAVPLSKRFKKHDPLMHAVLFGPDNNRLVAAAHKAYRRAKWGAAPISDVFNNMLYRVFANAMELSLSETKSLGKPYGNIANQSVQDFQAAGRRKKGPPIKIEKTAIRLARRYERLLPHVQKLHAFVKEREDRQNEAALVKEVKKAFPNRWLPHVTNGDAFCHLPGISKDESVSRSLSALEWTPRRLTVGIIVCEERKRNPKFSISPNSLYEKYIRLGREILRRDRTVQYLPKIST